MEQARCVLVSLLWVLSGGLEMKSKGTWASWSTVFNLTVCLHTLQHKHAHTDACILWLFCGFGQWPGQKKQGQALGSSWKLGHWRFWVKGPGTERWCLAIDFGLCSVTPPSSPFAAVRTWRKRLLHHAKQTSEVEWAHTTAKEGGTAPCPG